MSLPTKRMKKGGTLNAAAQSLLQELLAQQQCARAPITVNHAPAIDAPVLPEGDVGGSTRPGCNEAQADRQQQLAPGSTAPASHHLPAAQQYLAMVPGAHAAAAAAASSQPADLSTLVTSVAGMDTETVMPSSSTPGPRGSREPPDVPTASAAASPTPQLQLSPAAARSSPSPSPSPGGSAAEWVPLLDHVAQLLVRCCGAPSKEEALEVLAVRNLVCYPNIYIFLNDVLRHKKVRTQLDGLKARDQRHGISHLGISCPCDIIHSDPFNPGADTTCAQYLAHLGHTLRHPELPCVEVLDNRLVKEEQQGSRRYKSFPVETVLIDVSVPGGARKPAGDGDWDLCDVPDTMGGVQRGRMPPWVAALFEQQQKAAAADVTPAAGAGVGSAVAAGPHGVEAATISHSGSMVGAAGASTAAGAEGEVSSPAGSQPAPVMPAAPQQPSSADASPAVIEQEAPAAGAGTAPAGSQPTAAAHPGEEQQPAGPGRSEPSLVHAVQSAGTAAVTGAETRAPAATGTRAGVNSTGSPMAPGHLAGSAPSAVLRTGSSPQHRQQPSALQLLPSDASPSDSNSSCSSHGAGDTDSKHPAYTSSLTPAPAAFAANHRGLQGPAFYTINSQFHSWVSRLYPTKSENEVMPATVEAVRQVLVERARSQLWTVAAVRPVGSYIRATSLRGSHDLDLLVELNVDTASRGHFKACRTDCLNAICTVLCQGPSGTGPAAGGGGGGGGSVVECGWQLDSHWPHWLRLYHPVLKLQLDVQVCQSPKAFDSCHGEPRRQLLQHMIQRAQHAAGQLPSPPASPSGAAAATTTSSSTTDFFTCPSEPNKLRTVLLTPLMTDIIKGVPQQCSRMYGYDTDSMVTDVIRAVKAWSKFGLPHALTSSVPDGVDATAGASAAAAPGVSGVPRSSPAAQMWVRPAGDQSHDFTKQPPGYMWEVFVLHVLHSKLQQAASEGTPPSELYPTQTRTLYLFLDVLHAASQLLRPAAPGSTADPIAVYSLYTREQCELFRGLWGPPGLLCTPYIISPVDPSYNCTENSPFKGWAAVTDAAGELYGQMIQAMGGSSDTAAAAAAAAAGAAAGQHVGSPQVGGGEQVWQQLLSGSSLGLAVAAFTPDANQL